MSMLETNLFSIENLRSLTSRYRLWRILGLRPDQPEYHQNCQHLQRLSYVLRQPALVIERSGEPYLVVPEQVSVLPAKYQLVRTIVEFQLIPETFELNYSIRSPETDEISLRFLRFLLQSALRRDARLWQPQAGRPFFHRVPASRDGTADRFSGFAARPVVTPDGGLGLCVDPTNCYVARDPLPVRVDRDEFNRRWKNTHCIYHFGDEWYDIKLEGLADRDASKHRFVAEGKEYTLFEFVMERAQKPISRELAQLPHDSAVLFYKDSRGQERSAPTALCYPVLDTAIEEVGARHGRAMPPPHIRRANTMEFVTRHLQKLEVAAVKLNVSQKPVGMAERRFEVPDLLFGNSVVLSVRGTPDARHTSLRQLGRTRLDLLRDNSAGFFRNAPLDRHYLFLPRSVHDSFGAQFISDLRAAVDALLPAGGYCPIVVTYEDHGPKTFVHQGRRILEAAEAAHLAPGYAVVMIHSTIDGGAEGEDQLAAMAIRRLRELHDLRAGVIHTEVARVSYHEERREDGSRNYVCAERQWGRLSGYLRNVALNHVLLANQRWPFVLAAPLHADLTIGIDVKYHTCGLIAVSGSGAAIRTFFDTSKQKERLAASQLKTYLVRLVREEAQAHDLSLRNIVLQRDGRVWPSEISGAQEALKVLKNEGILAEDASITILEISKSAPARLRLYALAKRHDRRDLWVENPEVGTFYVAGAEAFLCSTGRAFPRPGTVQPLHVRLVTGSMPFEQCLEDLFALTTLAWTRPEDCTRYPITLKLNDRFLRAEAGEYDADALQFGDSSEEGEVA